MQWMVIDSFTSGCLVLNPSESRVSAGHRAGAVTIFYAWKCILTVFFSTPHVFFWPFIFVGVLRRVHRRELAASNFQVCVTNLFSTSTTCVASTALSSTHTPIYCVNPLCIPVAGLILSCKSTVLPTPYMPCYYSSDTSQTIDRLLQLMSNPSHHYADVRPRPTGNADDSLFIEEIRIAGSGAGTLGGCQRRWSAIWIVRWWIWYWRGRSVEQRR